MKIVNEFRFFMLLWRFINLNLSILIKTLKYETSCGIITAMIHDQIIPTVSIPSEIGVLFFVNYKFEVVIHSNVTIFIQDFTPAML